MTDHPQPARMPDRLWIDDGLIGWKVQNSLTKRVPYIRADLVTDYLKAQEVVSGPLDCTVAQYEALIEARDDALAALALAALAQTADTGVK